MSEPDADPEEPVSSEPRSARQSLVLLLAVFVVVTVCVNLWPDDGPVASSAEATGIPAEAVIASLAAERREHAARAAATRALEAATAAAAPTSGETQSQNPGGKTGSKDEGSQSATTEPGGGGQTPAKENLTLPIVGETPLPEPKVPGITVPDVSLPGVSVPDVSVPGVSTPKLPALPDVPPVPGTLLP